MTHWHIGTKYTDPTVASLSDVPTRWCQEEAQEEVQALNDMREGFGFNEFVWTVEGCESLECLVEEMAK